MTSDAVKALAGKYKLDTADMLPPPPAVDETPAGMPPGRVRWPRKRRELFARWGLWALYVAGPKHPIPRAAGDNRLGWPLRIGTTGSFADQMTRVMDGYSPFHWQGVWLRVWAPMGRVRDLAHLVVERLLPPPEGTLEDQIARWVLAERIEAKPSWLDVGPGFDPPGPADIAIEQDLGLREMPPHAPGDAVRERRFKVVRRKLELAILDLAAMHAIEAWTDEGVERQLDRWERERV